MLNRVFVKPGLLQGDPFFRFSLSPQSRKLIACLDPEWVGVLDSSRRARADDLKDDEVGRNNNEGRRRILRFIG